MMVLAAITRFRKALHTTLNPSQPGTSAVIPQSWQEVKIMGDPHLCLSPLREESRGFIGGDDGMSIFRPEHIGNRVCGLRIALDPIGIGRGDNTPHVKTIAIGYGAVPEQ
jgi:hypothetical protein